MISTMQKLTVLSTIAKSLNDKKITWAVGASLLLYFHGMTDHFEDIDIMVAEEDVPVLKAALLELGQMLPPKLNRNYKTKQFIEFVINDVDVDVMAGFTIVKDSKEYYFPLEKAHISDTTIVNEQSIPLHSIQQWRKYYALMGREEKVRMIDKTW